LAADLEAWLDGVRGREASERLGYEVLAWSHALPVLSSILPAAPWSELFDCLVEFAQNAGHSPRAAEPLAQQLLAGELPLTLAYLFPEFSKCRRLSTPGGKLVATSIVDWLDGEGLPAAEYFPLARPLFACWTRCGYLHKMLSRASFPREAKTQYEWLVRQMLRLCRYDGTQVLSDESAGSWSRPLFQAALHLAADAVDREIAARIVPGRKAADIPSPPLPSPSVNSKWATAAVMRRDWTRASDQLAVTYCNRQLALELNCGRETVFSGVCHPQLRFNGQSIECVDDWEEACWISDEELDYLELEGRYEHGLRVQRHLLLARRDRLLLIADAILSETAGSIECRNELPLCPTITFQPDDETREGILVGRRRIGTVLPLQLPEWRRARVDSALEATEHGLVLRQQTNSQRMFCPLLIDLDARRIAHPRTWRQATVAQQLAIVAADVAAGYRIQLGQQQWLLYRSLAPVASRTVLGQNLSGEFVFARFTRQGIADKLIEIE